MFIGYFLLKKLEEPAPKPIYLEKENIKEQFNWQNNLPHIKNLILEKFRGLPPDLNITLEKLIDINQDGIDEALIDLNYGGAAVANFTLVKLKNGIPQIVRFKDKNGMVKEKILNQGTGGAGRYGFEFGFENNEGIMFQASFFAYNSPEDYCRVEAYIYDNSNDYFEYDETKSKLLTEKYCKNLCNSINDETKKYFVNLCK